MRTRERIFATLLVAALGPVFATARQKPSWQPPLERDFDTRHISEPRTRRNSQFYDFFDATFFQQAKQAFDLPRYVRKKPAMNVNSVDQVPDSSWFTNRITRRPLTPEEIRRGPNRGDGPSGTGIWMVVAGKTSGVTPGFTIQDERGDRYLIKFDPPDSPEMATGAEGVATKIYFASGYHTPENYVVRFDPQRLRVAPEASFTDVRGRERGMTAADLQDVLARVPRRPDGRIRALASRLLAGKNKGPFAYHGLRRDDPNDWIPHEHRRELRGLRVIAGWLHDNDIREQNTLDVYVTEDGRSFLRHYLIDFGSALGSDSVKPNIERVGFEYIYDHGEVAKALVSLGLYERPWARRRIVVHPAVGYLDAERFDPFRWKPNYPIVAFENLSVADGYWAAKIVMSFTPEQVRAAVEAGEYSDPAAADYLVRVLLERRNKIGRYWFARAGGLDRFELAADGPAPALRFRDLNVEYGFARPAERRYRYRIREGRGKSEWRELAPGDDLAIPLADLDNHPGTRVIELQARDRQGGAWSPAVAVHVGARGAGARILGWVREEE